MLRFFSDKPGKMDMETHRQNYRMAFDAMRAYHQSEIDHKRDVIAVLNNILITMLTVFGGIYYLIFSASVTVNKWALYGIVLITCLLYLLLIMSLKRKNTEKIKADNRRYEQFREECNIERDHLGLTRFFEQAPLETYWDYRKKQTVYNPLEKGYMKTLGIINLFANLLILINILAAAVALAITFMLKA